MSRRLRRLYSRLYCHLCEEMLAALRDRQGSRVFDLEIIDIDEESDLTDRLNDQIPLLTDAGGTVVCQYFFDEAAFLDYFRDPGE